jgi:hypothetical protein
MLRRTLVALLVVFGFAVGWRASADSPPVAPGSEPIHSANRRYTLVIDPIQKLARVFRATRLDRPAWQMPAQFSTASISDNGRFLVASYRGGNLLDLTHAPDEIMLSFYDRGRLLSHVRLNELVREGDLVRTMSHYVWAVSFEFVSAARFRLETIDHRVHIFNAATGRPLDR